MNKPIRYVLNSHSHSHSLSVIRPFIEKGAKLVTAKENLEIYNKRNLFGDEKSEGHTKSIIAIRKDTILLADTANPIEVLHLKKSEYKSIPTKTFLFFVFPKKDILFASCMVYLQDIHENHGFEATIYTNRLVAMDKIVDDKNITVKNTSQLYGLRKKNDEFALPVFPLSFMRDVLEHGWKRQNLYAFKL